MICSRCGVTVADDDLFCLNCGSRLDAPTASGVQNTVSYQQPAYVQSNAQSTLQHQQLNLHPDPRPAPVMPGSDSANTWNELMLLSDKQKRKNRILLAVIALLVILIAAGVAAFFAFGGTDLFAKEEETTLSEPDAAEELAPVQGNTTTSYPVFKETTEFQNETTAFQQEKTTVPGGYTTLPPAIDAPTTQHPDFTFPQHTVPATQVNGDGYTKTSSGLMMPAEGNREGICEAYNNAVNSYKRYMGTVTLHRTEEIYVSANDLPIVVGEMVNGVISNLTVPTDETYTYRGGYDSDGRYIGDGIMPRGRDAQVTEYDVLSADITENEDGGYTITLYFPYEASTYSEGITWDEPTSHMTAMDQLDFSAIDLGAITVNEAEMRYPGATAELTVDSHGRLVRLYNYLPLEGECEASYGFINFSLSLDGDMTSLYEMTYFN